MPKHKHNWMLLSAIDRESHTPPDKHITYTFKQVCDCGAYQYKEFKHIQDIDDLQAKNDDNDK